MKDPDARDAVRSFGGAKVSALFESDAAIDYLWHPVGMSTDYVGGRIDQALRTPGLNRLVDAYFDPDGPFAGSAFDTLEPGPPNAITSADLLAVTFLDVRVRPLAVRRMLGQDAAKLERLLAGLPVGVTLWEATDADLAAMAAAWDYLCSYKGIAGVMAGKLLARKRPMLVPVVDSVILAALDGPPNDTWATLAAALQDEDRRRRIEALRPPTAPEAVSTLRLLDVALWMLGSQSRNAKRARSAVE